MAKRKRKVLNLYDIVKANEKKLDEAEQKLNKVLLQIKSERSQVRLDELYEMYGQAKLDIAKRKKTLFFSKKDAGLVSGKGKMNFEADKIMRDIRERILNKRETIHKISGFKSITATFVQGGGVGTKK